MVYETYIRNLFAEQQEPSKIPQTDTKKPNRVPAPETPPTVPVGPEQKPGPNPAHQPPERKPQKLIKENF